jgi:hypothetical protein
LSRGLQIFFAFEDEGTSQNAVVCANIAASILSKQALLATLATKLSFPDYFGENWDALEECIADLSWLPIGPVIVRHADVPLVGDPRNAKIYVAECRRPQDVQIGRSSAFDRLSGRMS